MAPGDVQELTSLVHEQATAWTQSGSDLGQRLEDRISALPHVSQATKITASAQLGLQFHIRQRTAKDASRDITLIQSTSTGKRLFTVTPHRGLEGAVQRKKGHKKDGKAVAAAWKDFQALHSKIHVDDNISQGWSKLRNGSLRKFQSSGDALSIREAMLKTVVRQSDDEESSESGDEGAGDDVDDEQWDEADRGLRARLAAERSDGGLLNEM
ncbi:unnamed protein product [Tilletia controversa]|nr:unnamed protein product [Tilletia controversa]